MKFDDKDHLFAVITPAAVLLLGTVLTWGSFFLMPLLYFVYRRLGWRQAKGSTLTLFDLTVSLILIAVVLGAFLAGLTVAARDGEFSLIGVTDGLLAIVLSLLGMIYYLICSVLLSVKTFQRKPYTPKLSMGIFAALRGRTPAPAEGNSL